MELKGVQIVERVRTTRDQTFGDAETMEGWLASTEILTEYDLRKAPAGGSSVTEAARTVIEGDDGAGAGKMLV